MLNVAELRSLQKIELHLHLDCSLSYDVVSVLDPSVTREEYEHEFIAPARCSNLADFLLRAPKGFKLMQSEDALRRVTEDLFHQLESDGVVYAEIRVAPCSIRSGSATAPAASRTRCLSSTCDAIGFTWNSVPVLTCRSYRQSEAWIIIQLIDSIGPEFS